MAIEIFRNPEKTDSNIEIYNQVVTKIDKALSQARKKKTSIEDLKKVILAGPIELEKISHSDLADLMVNIMLTAKKEFKND